MNQTNQIIYISDIEAYKSLIEETPIAKNCTPLITKDNLGLIYINSLLIDLEEYPYLESLGDYEDMFSDEEKHAKYLSVNDYLTPITYTDEEDNEVEYYKPKYIGKFASKKVSDEEYKEAKLMELKEEREYLASLPLDGFDVGKMIDRENIQGAISHFDTISTDGLVKWTMADNTERLVSLEDLQNVLDGYVLRKAQIFSNYQEAKGNLK